MKPKSKGEETAVRAMLGAQDPDARIKAADDLITKFADTEFKPYALYLEADAYAQKGDNDKAIVYGEQALEADPKSYQSAILLCKTYASTTHNNGGVAGSIFGSKTRSLLNSAGHLSLVPPDVRSWASSQPRSAMS